MLCAYDIADRLASMQRSLSLFNEHTSHSEYLSKHRDEREKFGCAVGRVLAQVQKASRDQLPDPTARPEVHPLAKKFLSSRMHGNLERCIGGLAKNLPYSAEGLSLALLYIDRLQRMYDDVVNCWTLDRMFATAVVVASKFAFDEVYPNTLYATRLGLSIYELNNLEITFLSLFNFSMLPDRTRWLRLHCLLARLAFEPTENEGGARGSCPCMELLPPSAKSRSCGNGGLPKSGLSTPSSPSPITPMITAVDAPSSGSNSTAYSSLRNPSNIKVTISSVASPESSSSSPKVISEAVKSCGKRHSQNTLERPRKSHHHHHHHHHSLRKSSIVDTN